ncbi:MAG: FAD binding domain-containing protein [Alphaproteobacteria bacterium]|nr:FAD binding domain-containing protein [Alphaproteobacteria bacterium]
MKPAPFDYVRPSGLADAVAAFVGAAGTGRLLAGGQSLGPMLNLRLARPSLLVDLRRVAELRQVEDRGDSVLFGAMTTHAAIEDGAVPDPTNGMMRSVAGDIAYRAVRTRGTIGGSLAHADPAADWVTCLTALGAILHLGGPGGTRTVPMSRFMAGAFATELGEAILVGVAVPKLSARARWGYYKICRKPGEFAEAIGAVVLDPARDYRAVVMGAVGGAPVLLEDIARRLPFDGAPAIARRDIAAAGPPMDDVDAQLHAVAVERAIARAYAA